MPNVGEILSHPENPENPENPDSDKLELKCVTSVIKYLLLKTY